MTLQEARDILVCCLGNNATRHVADPEIKEAIEKILEAVNQRDAQLEEVNKALAWQAAQHTPIVGCHIRSAHNIDSLFQGYRDYMVRQRDNYMAWMKGKL